MTRLPRLPRDRLRRRCRLLVGRDRLPAVAAARRATASSPRWCPRTAPTTCGSSGSGDATAADASRPPRRRPRVPPSTRRSELGAGVVDRPYDDVTILSSPGGFVFCLVPGDAASARRPPPGPTAARRTSTRSASTSRRAGTTPSWTFWRGRHRLAAARPGARVGVRPAHTGPGAAAAAAPPAARRRAGRGHRAPRLGASDHEAELAAHDRRRRRGAGPPRVVDRAPRPRRPDLLRHPAADQETDRSERRDREPDPVPRGAPSDLPPQGRRSQPRPAPADAAAVRPHPRRHGQAPRVRRGLVVRPPPREDAQSEPWASVDWDGRPRLGLALRGRRRPRAALGAVGGRGRPLAGGRGRRTPSRAARRARPAADGRQPITLRWILAAHDRGVRAAQRSRRPDPPVHRRTGRRR